jgi:hypothetical protein
LERQTEAASLGGYLHGDAYSFAKLFEIPHGWDQPRTTQIIAGGRAQP